MIEDLNSQKFSEHLNSEFKLLLPNAQPLVLRLSEVKEHASAPQFEQFSLFFYGPESPRLQQNIYRLQHEKLGTLDLFLVPVGLDPEGMHYECAFNRLRKPAGS